jgi:NAD(P)-dependent dehydrogenase (short-subunit alcohol dehydrogenase family)
METNFFGVVSVTRAVLPMMRSQRSGRVINVSSIAGRLSAPTMSIYSASKYAVEGLSEGLRYEVADFGIHVVLIEPGMFKTEIAGRNQKSAKRMLDPSSPYFEKSQAAERMRIRADQSRRDPQEVADAIVHAATVAHPNLRYLVGIDAKAEGFLKRVLPDSVYEAAVNAVLKRASRSK